MKIKNGDKIIYFGKEYAVLDYDEEENIYLIESESHKEYPMWVSEEEINLSDYLQNE